MFAMPIREIHKKRAQGWTFQEATLGKNWQEKYPNIASWQGGYGIASRNCQCTLSLSLYSSTNNHSTEYRVVEAHVDCASQEEAFQGLEAAIGAWNEEHGPDVIARFKSGWMGKSDWKTHHPHISWWLEQGKCHCIRIQINCVTHQASAKAWHYNKPTDTETILFEVKNEYKTESEILQMLDIGIKHWLAEHDYRPLLCQGEEKKSHTP
jgi:hypothetical protein